MLVTQLRADYGVLPKRGQIPTKQCADHDYTDFVGPDNGPVSAWELGL